MASTDVSVPPTVRPKFSPEQKLVLGIQTSKARGKAHYAKAATQLTELKALAGPGKTIEMPDGRRFAVVDTFKDLDVFKKMVFADRFELQEVK